MSRNFRISGRLVCAARSLAGVSQKDFAAAAGLPVKVVAQLERSGSAYVESEHELQGICRSLDHFGIIIIDESDGMGAGVRLKFTRQDVRQIVRFEGEGGLVGSDDAP